MSPFVLGLLLGAGGVLGLGALTLVGVNLIWARLYRAPSWSREQQWRVAREIMP